MRLTEMPDIVIDPGDLKITMEEILADLLYPDSNDSGDHETK